MRYFRFCYMVNNKRGSITLPCNRFPVENLLIKIIKATNKGTKPVITSMFEFKNKDDFDNFRKD